MLSLYENQYSQLKSDVFWKIKSVQFNFALDHFIAYGIICEQEQHMHLYEAST